ncbi:ion channel protein [Luedemannella flava]|uniref:Ion channel protein n=2 Tax=Luedemannella flava TaxID=349316 RepID=A0ABN2LSH6_9ACTN
MLAITPAAIVVGVGCSLLLLVVSWLSETLRHGLWESLPRAWGFDGSTWWWIMLVLTATGLAVGLVVAYVPGHAGPDPATEELIGPPHPASTVPSVLLAATLALAGGVSLGPENPITAANVALACALGVAWRGRDSTPVWVGLAGAGTIGAMFGSPVAAALVLSELPGTDPREPLWDRLFAPLIAACAGSITTLALAQPVFSVDVPPYPGFRPVDIVSAGVIAVIAGLVGIAMVEVFPKMYGLFRRLRHPVAALTCGGLVLGGLGVIGGQITLFKGLSEMKELVAGAAGYPTVNLVVILLVKSVAVVVAASCGFRGGRIFPAIFIGAAVGLVAVRLVPGVPLGLAIGCGVLGVVLAITHQGWLSLLLAATVVMDARLLLPLCIAVLPAWLLIRGRPGMVIGKMTG